MGTASSKLEILIEAILHGKGFQDTEEGFRDTADAARDARREVGDSDSRFQKFGLTLTDMAAGAAMAAGAVMGVVEAGKQVYEFAKVVAVDAERRAHELRCVKYHLS